MKKTITHKLFLTLLLTSIVVVTGMYLIMQWSFDRGFVRYMEAREQQTLATTVEQLATIYEEDGGWQKLRDDPERWVRLMFTLHRHTPSDERVQRIVSEMEPGRWPPFKAPEPPKDLPPPLELRVRLLDADHSVIYGWPDREEKLDLYPIEVENRTVGYLGVERVDRVLSQSHDLQFVEQQTESFLLIAGAMLLASAGLSLPLARHFVKPIRALTAATRQLAGGDYTPRITYRSEDELGRLARDFNELARTLERNENLRRQWVADISHELRTPISILRGEIEAIQDGVRVLEPQAMESLHQEVLHLSRLVDDLYELSMSDIGALAYHKEAVDLGELVGDCLDALEGEFTARGITLERRGLDSASAWVEADPDRLTQLFGNLLSNTLRYTEAGGRARVTLVRAGERIGVTLEDSAPGVAPEELPRLFDRLYRSEHSRNRRTGGTGLGLAISKNIAEAHDGTLAAAASPLGGLAVTLTLPALTEEPA